MKGARFSLMAHKKADKGVISIIIPLALALLFFCWGVMIFFIVGDRGPGGWFYGSQEDVPGQSPFSTERIKVSPLSRPRPAGQAVQPQHVDGSVNPLSKTLSEEESIDGQNGQK